MMSDDMLSQEEINALLNGMTDDKNNDDFNQSSSLYVSDYLSDLEEDALGEIGNISFGSAATALSTLLNQKVDITTPKVSLIERKNLNEEFPKPHVAVHVQYTEGFEGMNLLVIHTNDAAIIADLMLGGEGKPSTSDLTEMHLSAVQESMNQMMGSASTSMSTIFNKKVDISPPSIDLMDVKQGVGVEQLPDEQTLVKISFRLKVGDLIDSNIMQLVTVSFAKKMIEELMNPSVHLKEEKKELFDEPINRVESKNTIDNESSYRTKEEWNQPISKREQQHLGTKIQNREVDVQPAVFTDFGQPALPDSESHNLNMLLDIPLQVTVELGRTKKSIKDILGFTQGSIIELDKLAGEPVDILVNQKLVAKGEVVVIDENFGVRVTDIISQEQRVKNLT
ncbi:flagellar motor switch protein FliN [Alkalihalobacillus alcalophilus ATCC 27647 = CGMCC 1.3604]|uniref:Flagellar motor switch protein FliN n=1 Tax=Alkalihalobacillus alcalophilus ATCC 27647 = CGMCC 1.3604 TaxID=1218173 RepID=A0A094WN40_ALKAL|nr:flagellar motor switch phosphatase FliY [Alkalihalobacillus alcalophilus]KGA98241.1 flagellar motor switch protein FliN [Alkalihalobacillus alcalophilus ATCC 27647 = CGMCC 1.3604]MED1562180.1 flagellar motor switch phosphatase FliY [Alkalihalobacillus alcalophilus]THG91405.1 flagellar motor switch protein FliN [Alkalihalobacillus alcalophilus ATCC 27647 = CGMCC 1.3604]